MDDAGVKRLAVAGRRNIENSHSKRIGAAAAYLTLGLLILDILSPPGKPLTTLIGVVVYASKTAFSIMITVLGLDALSRTRLPIMFRLSMILYIIIVLVWFFLWAIGIRSLHSSNSGAITYLFNPTHSIWSWLFILVVPVVAKWNVSGQITSGLRQIPLALGLIFMLVPCIGIGLFQWNVVASSAGVFMLFLLALRPRRMRAVKIGHFIFSLVICGAMLFAGYRIYAIAALLFGLNLYMPKRRKLLMLQILFISVCPVFYSFLINNYGFAVSGQENSLFQDTRSFLFTELVSDLSSTELWTGRGFDASYYSPYFRYVARHFATDVGYNNIWRTTSEIGWLNVILHFGILALAAFYVAVISPIIFYSQRKAAFIPVEGIYCFLPVMTLLFAGELWSAINVSYLSWYIALGMLLTNRPPMPTGHFEESRESQTGRSRRHTHKRDSQSGRGVVQ